ncbi:P-loop containing nucleoside triphosphate hydrolase protein [Amylocystis lapponica]|nr:P-loop containing nucleoside triphosphate hydrolase protein [Amylocystis lapponica]
MEGQPLTSITTLSAHQRTALKQGSILTVADLLLSTPAVISKKCKLPPDEVQRVIGLVCRQLAHQPRTLEDVAKEGDEKFTTGDPQLDSALGGGIRPGMLWEVVGESAAGKTQLALQLSLMVQLPRRLGGLAGSACIITTTSTLPTSRIMEMSRAHPLLSPSLCGLAGIHTMKAPEISILLHVLSSILPALLDDRASRPGSKPVKLLVIDTLTELFHSENTVSSDTLMRRSKALIELSSLLHFIANKYHIAVVVLNEVIATFDRVNGADSGEPDEVLYHDQARLFGRANSIPGEDRREASLGLTWANQVNTRIMLSRTERTRFVDDVDDRATKRRKLEGDVQCVDPRMMRIRRLSVIFSPLVAPSSLDYVVTDEGISTIPENPAFFPPQPLADLRLPPLPATPDQNILGVSPFDVNLDEEDPGLADNGVPSSSNAAGAIPEVTEAEAGPPGVEEDEWDQYWKDADTEEALYGNVGIDALPPASTLLDACAST